jgi:hypothetical protein
MGKRSEPVLLQQLVPNLHRIVVIRNLITTGLRVFVAAYPTTTNGVELFDGQFVTGSKFTINVGGHHTLPDVTASSLECGHSDARRFITGVKANN